MQALTGAELHRAGRTSAALPFVSRSGGTLSALSNSQRVQLHPRGGWLVGFSPDGTGRAWLHLPFLRVTWLTPPPARKTRQVVGGYWHAPECGEGDVRDLRELLAELRLGPVDFPHQLRSLRGSLNAAVALRPSEAPI